MGLISAMLADLRFLWSRSGDVCKIVGHDSEGNSVFEQEPSADMKVVASEFSSARLLFRAWWCNTSVNTTQMHK